MSTSSSSSSSSVDKDKDRKAEATAPTGSPATQTTTGVIKPAINSPTIPIITPTNQPAPAKTDFILKTDVKVVKLLKDIDHILEGSVVSTIQRGKLETLVIGFYNDLKAGITQSPVGITDQPARSETSATAAAKKHP